MTESSLEHYSPTWCSRIHISSREQFGTLLAYLVFSYTHLQHPSGVVSTLQGICLRIIVTVSRLVYSPTYLKLPNIVCFTLCDLQLRVISLAVFSAELCYLNNVYIPPVS